MGVAVEHESSVKAGKPKECYEVGDRVVWNKTIRATVIVAFENGPWITYRLRLDESQSGAMEVGNITGGSLLPLAEPAPSC